MRIVIAGGGIAGLSIAWALRKREPAAHVTVLERSPRTGGNIRTEHVNGYLCESGPNGFLDDAPATMALVREVGLSDRLEASQDSARRRFIFHRERLHEVPVTVGGFLTTSLISPIGKVRIACEPFAHRRRDEDESIYGFAARRLGSEAASVLVESMVSGVFAGNAHALSLRATFPKLWQLEQEHGSLFRAQLAKRRRRPRGVGVGTPGGRLTSFRSGLSELPEAITQALGSVVCTSMPIQQLRRGTDFGARWSAHGYTVSTPAGTIRADAVVLAGPAAESARLVRPFDGALATVLDEIPTAPLAVVCLGFDAAALRAQGSMDGFGFLVCPSAGARILGALWDSSIYRHRAPEGKVLLRAMIGGTYNAEAVALEDRELVSIVRTDLARTMAVTVAPELTRVVRHPGGIPQYVQGHLFRLERAEVLLRAHPGLYLAGNSYRGVSINACIADADRVADEVLRGPRALDAQSDKESPCEEPALA